MYRSLSLLLLAVAVLASGCSLCSTPYDCHYPAYGGSRPRANMVYGRVGSAFNDAGAQPVETIEGEIIEGQIVDEGYFQGEVIQGEVIQGGDSYSGETIEGEIIEGEVIQGEIWEGGSEVIQGEIIDAYAPESSEIIELPNTNTDLPAPSSEIVPSVPNYVPDPVIPTSPQEALGNPFETESAVPSLNQGSSARNNMPSMNNIYNGLPPARGARRIELSPAVVPY